MDLVAPHTGAWIETVLFLSHLARQCASHPTRVRGLKLRCLVVTYPQCVSIHAPVLGAIHGVQQINQGCRVSIHAPVWGAT